MHERECKGYISFNRGVNELNRGVNELNRGVNELNRCVNHSVARQGCNLLRVAVTSAVTSQGCCCGNLQIHPLGLGHHEPALPLIHYSPFSSCSMYQELHGTFRGKQNLQSHLLYGCLFLRTRIQTLVCAPLPLLYYYTCPVVSSCGAVSE